MIHHDTCIALCCNVYTKDIEWYRSLTSHFTTYAWLGSSTRRWDLQSCPFVMMRRFETRFGTWFAPQLYRKTLIRPEWHLMRRIITNQSISQTPWSTLKPLEMDRAVQFQHNGWKRLPSAPLQVKLSDCSFQENTGTCIAARNSATVVVERGTFTQNGAPVIQLRDSTTLRCLSLRIPVQGLMVLFLECLELLSLGLIELKPGSSAFFGVVLCCWISR